MKDNFSMNIWLWGRIFISDTAEGEMWICCAGSQARWVLNWKWWKKSGRTAREISSTFIREEIQKGHIKKANHLLGYPYFACGTVVHGKHLGSRLGFATINITPPPEKLLPPFGVYVTQVRIDGRTYRGVTNVGVKPTIEGERLPGIETHIFDFSGELYGERVCVSFFDFLRPEQKFFSVEALRSPGGGGLSRGLWRILSPVDRATESRGAMKKMRREMR